MSTPPAVPKVCYMLGLWFNFECSLRYLADPTPELTGIKKVLNFESCLCVLLSFQIAAVYLKLGATSA